MIHFLMCMLIGSILSGVVCIFVLCFSQIMIYLLKIFSIEWVIFILLAILIGLSIYFN